jgi:uncharacterized protein (TIGR03067 family)
MPALRHGSSVAESQSFGEFSFPRLYGVYLMICVAVLASSFAWRMLATQEKDLRQKRELERWQGTWRAVAGERDGQLRPKAFLEALRIVVENDVMTIQAGKRSQKLRLVLDPTVRPKAVDLIHLDGKEQGEVWLGIYQLEPQRLKLCVSPPGTPRPDDFVTRPGSGRELLILERTDSHEKSQPTPGPGK